MDRRVLDRRIFQELEEDLEGHVTPVVNAFLDKLSKRVEAIAHAIAESNADALRQEAHPLKSMSRQIGVMELAEIASKLEEKGRLGELSDIEPLLTRLEKEAPRVMLAMKQAVTQRGE